MLFSEPRGWGFVGEVLPGSRVELPHHVVDVPGAVDGQVSALGEILADPAYMCTDGTEATTSKQANSYGS